MNKCKWINEFNMFIMFIFYLMVLFKRCVIFKNVWYARHFEYSCKRCSWQTEIKTNDTAIKFARETTNSQWKKYNSVKHLQRQQFSFKKTSIHNRITRQMNMLHLPRVRTDLAKNSFNVLRCYSCLLYMYIVHILR